MAEHKVPQDVEADDKLLGPLSFRQFIYAMIALAAAALAYFLATMIAIPLAVVPLPITLVFGTLAIPRRGQPMEIYIGALIHFYFYPTKRLWNPDGQESLVEITNPPIDSTPQTKDISSAEATQRLSFLADVVDTQGWSTRGNVNLYDDYALAANTVTDVFEDTSLNNELSQMLEQSEQRARQAAVTHMQTLSTAPATPAPTTQASFTPPTYTPPSAAAATTPPPAAPAMPTEDEAALSAMLKQSAANSMTAFRQTVVQPPSTSPVPDNPTLTTTATPAPAATPPPTTAPESAIMETSERETELAQDSPRTSTVTQDAATPRRSEIDDNQSGEISLR
ncbi:PrgI family protein [Candidatus Saccharibacteria bacterium]|nr:PrgI family protein [Candidatus Saccharibacteria bacterium]